MHRLIEFSIDSIDSLISFAALAGESLGYNCWFRGHAMAEWSLVASVHRDYDLIRESSMATSFQLRAPARYSACPDSQDYGRWITLMRHYGLPTRLLDWTNSLLTAAYFALLHEPDKNGPATIWALCPARMNEVIAAIGPRLEIMSSPRVRPLLKSVFEQSVAIEEAIAVEADQIDQRMALQQCAYTIHGSPAPLDEHNQAHQFLRRFTIPAEHRERLRGEAVTLGARREAMFPDLENLAKAVAADYPMRHEIPPSDLRVAGGAKVLATQLCVKRGDEAVWGDFIDLNADCFKSAIIHDGGDGLLMRIMVEGAQATFVHRVTEFAKSRHVGRPVIETASPLRSGG